MKGFEIQWKKILLYIILSEGEASEPNFGGNWTRLEESQFHYLVWLKIFCGATQQISSFNIGLFKGQGYSL